MQKVFRQGDFIYDYYIDPSGREELGLYTFGCSDQLDAYRIICIGEGCHAAVEENRLIMNCPPGKSCLLTLMDESGRISDTVAIRNKASWPVKLAQYLENHMRKEFRNGENSSSVDMLKASVIDVARAINEDNCRNLLQLLHV